MFVLNRRLVVLSATALLLVVLAVLLQVSSRPAEAAGDAAALDYYTCTPRTVAAFNNRIHVRCTAPAPGNIWYFAACYSQDSATVSRYLSVLTTAFALGKNVGVNYAPSDTSGTSCGCQAADCRLILSVEVLP